MSWKINSPLTDSMHLEIGYKNPSCRWKLLVFKILLINFDLNPINLLRHIQKSETLQREQNSNSIKTLNRRCRLNLSKRLWHFVLSSPWGISPADILVNLPSSLHICLHLRGFLLLVAKPLDTGLQRIAYFYFIFNCVVILKLWNFSQEQ